MRVKLRVKKFSFSDLTIIKTYDIFFVDKLTFCYSNKLGILTHLTSLNGVLDDTYGSRRFFCFGMRSPLSSYIGKGL